MSASAYDEVAEWYVAWMFDGVVCNMARWTSRTSRRPVWTEVPGAGGALPKHAAGRGHLTAVQTAGSTL